MAKATDSHTQAGTAGIETEAAFQLHLDDGSSIWIPFSQIHAISRDPSGECRVVMTKWIAEKKGLL